MKKTLLELYALAVCFVATCAIGIALCTGLYSLFEIIRPDITMNSYSYSKFTDNDSYWDLTKYSYNSCKDCKEERPSEEVLTKKRTESQKFALEGEAREGFDSLVKSLITIFGSMLLLIIHWIIGKKQRLITHN